MSASPEATPRSAFPGMIVSIALAAAALAVSAVIGTTIFRTEHSPVSPVMLAVVFGLLFSQTSLLGERLNAGASFAATWIIQAGIVLVGLKLSFGSTLDIAMRALPIVLCCLAVAAATALLLARAFGLRRELGMLIAIGTSICGCTAVLASAPLLRARSEEVGCAVSCVVLIGLTGMLSYPWLAHMTLGADATAVGVFLGTSIHDTSQVIGAALLYMQTFGEPQALAAATVAKLLRNLTLVLLLPALALLAQRAPATSTRGDATACTSPLHKIRSAVPGFVVAFLLCVLLSNIGDAAAAAGQISATAWKQFGALAGKLSEYALTIGMAGVGLTLSIQKLTPLGMRPFVVAVACAVAVLAASWTLTGALS